MGIFNRMGRVIQSNLNALLDRAEDDRKLVELDLDEMDEQIKAGHQEVVTALASEKQLDKRCSELVCRGDSARNTSVASVPAVGGPAASIAASLGLSSARG